MASRASAPAAGDVRDSLLDAIGDTPMVRLSRLEPTLRTPLLAKVEYLNPGGSIKDRVALAMVEAAERDGHLQPGGTIVEPTSGNTGTGLAIAARLKGYRVIAVMPDKMSREKVDLLRAYGAEVVIAPTNVEPESPESYYSVAKRLTREIPGAFQPNQYANPANPQAHYEATGPEIWEQTGGRITHLVVGVGTGGTITGTAKYLRERNPDLVVVGADPEGSIYSSADVRSYLVEGVGEDFWPQTFDPAVVDRYVTVSDKDSFLMTRRLAQTEGMLVGGSCGTAAYAALEVAREVDDPEAQVVVILPDGGRSYLSKIFNDDWMRSHGFLERPTGRTVGDVLELKATGGGLDLLTIARSAHARDAIALLHEHAISQLPVVGENGGVVGSIGERELLRRAVADPGVLERPVSEVLEPPLLAIDADSAVQEAVAQLTGPRTALVVIRDGRPVGVVTRADLLDAFAR